MTINKIDLTPLLHIMGEIKRCNNEGKGYSETAEELGIPRSTVKDISLGMEYGMRPENLREHLRNNGGDMLDLSDVQGGELLQKMENWRSSQGLGGQ